MSKLGGSGDITFPQENFKFKSSKMAINASKTANSDRLMESVIITLALKTNE